MTASPAVTSEAPQLQAGDKAPDFSMPTSGGEQAGETISLASFAGKQNLVLYFYPKDDTPGCTQEAKEFKEMLGAFKAADTAIIGVSKDPISSHEKFQKKFCLPFPLASDESGETCLAYHVWVQKSMYGKSYMGIDRATFLIDKNSVIRKVWRKVKVDGHVAAVLEAAQKL